MIQPAKKQQRQETTGEKLADMLMPSVVRRFLFFFNTFMLVIRSVMEGIDGWRESRRVQRGNAPKDH